MMRRTLLTGLALLAACASGGRSAPRQQDSVPGAMTTTPVAFAFPAADTANALHLLSRLTFGPRPGDIAEVQRLGIARWLERQLDPASLADPAEAAARRAWPAAYLPPAELYRRYPPPQLQRRQAAARAGAMAPAEAAPPDSDAVRRLATGQRALAIQVQMATLTRHVASERQVQEVMADFWFNHFNVFIGKNAARWTTADYMERAIRPHALGRFEDLLLAVARHPAMLVYLDNAQSVAPGARPPALARRFIQRNMPEVARRMPTGLNENYARELLELHTLGVDGGYTQEDVQNVARVLTGWSVSAPPGAPGAGRIRARPLEFQFNAWAHDRGEKLVLGDTFPAGRAEDEGVRLLRILARHPATAHHIARKLCIRFVADEAPDNCVDRAAAAFRRTGGDIRATLRAIVASDDFWAPANRRNKIRSPLEFVAGAVRALGGAPDTLPRLAGALQMLGQPLFGQPVPTGWPETQEDWVNSGALLSRMNLAMAFAGGRMSGLSTDLDRVVPLTADREQLVARVNAAILSGQASGNTLRVLREQVADLGDPRMARAMAVGLALGSPEFQRQ